MTTSLHICQEKFLLSVGVQYVTRGSLQQPDKHTHSTSRAGIEGQLLGSLSRKAYWNM